MPDLLPELGTTWHYARTSSGFSIRLGHQHGTHRFTQIAFVSGTGKKQERLARAITALPELARELGNCHDVIGYRKPVAVAHDPGERPETCNVCAVLNRVQEVQP